MGSKLISFRLQDDAMEAIQALKRDNESPALTAQRLLTDALGLSAKGETNAPRRESLARKLMTDILNDAELLEELRQALTRNLEAGVAPNNLVTTPQLFDAENEAVNAGQDIPLEVLPELEDTTVMTPDAEADLTEWGVSSGDDVSYDEAVNNLSTIVDIVPSSESVALAPSPSEQRSQLKDEGKSEKLPQQITSALRRQSHPQTAKQIIKLVGKSNNVKTTLNRLEKSGKLSSCVAPDGDIAYSLPAEESKKTQQLALLETV